MANKALALYTGSSSTFNLDEIPQGINLVSENTFVREEARAVMMAPLAVTPPLLSGASGGTSVQLSAEYRWQSFEGYPMKVD